MSVLIDWHMPHVQPTVPVVSLRQAQQSCPWVGLTHGLGLVGFGRDFSVFGGLGWVGLGPL